MSESLDCRRITLTSNEISPYVSISLDVIESYLRTKSIDVEFNELRRVIYKKINMIAKVSDRTMRLRYSGNMSNLSFDDCDCLIQTIFRIVSQASFFNVCKLVEASLYAPNGQTSNCFCCFKYNLDESF